MGISRQTRVESTRSRIKRFALDRKQVKDMDEQVKADQPEIIDAMKSVDPDNDGIVIFPDDSRGTAYVQQNDGSLIWNEEQIIEWLDKPVAGRKRLKQKCESRVFDINKWEAAVASGEVPKKVARRFQEKTDPPKPFIRFGKKGDKSK